MARKILLADDSVTAQNMGRKILADAGYEVITVNNGSAALKKINEQHPDLIVLDVYMPGYSGLEVCQRLKDVPDTSRIPILLTVGKLEPFKPEEARRARADGFIVKPFEASELLSALSKLEDKVVPRGETSKTGRFARTMSAIEDNKFDRSMAVENDSGWKTRIVFPKKKNKPAEEEETEDPAAYASARKDARRADEPKPAEKAPAAPPAEEEARVDLGALASSGLPKDVTPEEIAALAAAAAQIKGTLAEEKVPEPVAEMPVVAPAEGEVPKPEAKFETPVADPVPAAVAEIPAPPAAETLAEQAVPEKAAEVEEKEKEAEVPATAAATAGVVSAETEAAQLPVANSGNRAWSATVPVKVEEPVTMAAAAAVGSGAAGPRWTAVAVALAPEDAGVSLEQEMQRMYSGYAAAEADRTAIFKLPEIPAPPAAKAPAAEVTSSTPSVSTPAEVVPEAAATMSAVANVATEAISAAVAELESVAAAYAAEKAAPATPAVASEVSESSSSSAVPVPETAQSTVSPADAKTEPVSVAEAVAPVPEVQADSTKTEAVKEPVKEEESRHEEVKAEPVEQVVQSAEPETAKIETPQAVSEEPAKEEPQQQEAKQEKEEIHEESKDIAPVVDAPVMETPAAAAAVEDRKAETIASEISEEPAMPAREASRSGGSDDMAKRESETAAAWASWRKIRETGNAKPMAEESEESNESSSKDAAMAVAAGAEHRPEEAESLENDPEISSIVDSVLADMRPKIVEEIARKLGKKK